MITTVQFKTLDDLYLFYNSALFEGVLSDCIVNMSRHSGSYGFFAARRWKAGEGSSEKRIHEISLNPDYLDRPFVEWHATFVHEMVHLWQEDFGHPSRGAYHNKEWAYKMETIGLIPSDTGEPGGKKTGQQMTHYINETGKFLEVFKRLSADALEALRLKYLPAYPHPEPARRRRGVDGGAAAGTDEEGGDDDEGEGTTGIRSSKNKYTCPCGNNVWGRPGLKIVCGECSEEFIEV